jgi:predicted metal-binding membrane protein
VLLTILGWSYVVHVARMPGMSAEPSMAMPGMDLSTGTMDGGSGTAPSALSALSALPALFAMWTAMMVGMMVPSVLPSVLLFASMARQRRVSGRAPLSVPAFVGGYLIIWIGFSLLAALLQTRLRVALLPLAAQSRAAAVAASAVLVTTGIYQWTRFKLACLSHCRSPLGHLTGHWREGRAGALRMGLEHGLLCLGCCWLLMALLFVGGVMNPYWVGGLALLVLLEKLAPRGEVLGRVAGVALAVWGVVLLVRS